MNILIAGQKWFGAKVTEALSELRGVKITHVSCPATSKDRMYRFAALKGLEIIPAGTLNKETMPDDIDLIVTAHSHDFIGEQTRLRARFGGIGYHPSLLPIHRGRDSVEWAIRMGDRVTGGTVYRLSNKMDGGNIISQEHVFIGQNDTASELWRRELSPLGVKLICDAVCQFRDNGFVDGKPQDETLATWEPSIGRAPVFRPDLILLGFQ